MKIQLTKYQVATAIAVLFHAIGLIGILFFYKTFFVQTTALNLLLMLLLIFYTQQKPLKHFIILFVICFFVGIMVEIIGTHTTALFGQYKYGDVLGPTIQGVPLIIGINWFIIIYCCGICIQTMLTKVINTLEIETGRPRLRIKAMSIIVDGATIAVLFDWLMEPVAVKLGYWKWLGNGAIPFYNYICWFLISVLLLIIFQFAEFPKQNKFAVNLLLIQAMFFLLLRTFL